MALKVRSIGLHSPRITRLRHDSNSSLGFAGPCFSFDSGWLLLHSIGTCSVRPGTQFELRHAHAAGTRPRAIPVVSDSLGICGDKLISGPWGYTDTDTRFLVPKNLDFGPKALVDLQTSYLRWMDRWLTGIENGIDNDDKAVQRKRTRTREYPACAASEFWPFPTRPTSVNHLYSNSIRFYG